MPLSITIPEKEFFDSATNRFIMVKKTKLELEHSLISISKWEAKWHKPYLSREEKTPQQALDYLRCMCTTKNVDPNIFKAIDRKQLKEIADYIADPQTGTTFKRKENKQPPKEVLSNELIYYWMTYYNIPFDPCAKWHLNHLMTLIEVCGVKNQDPKKRSTREMLNERAALNAKRRAKYHSRG